MLRSFLLLFISFFFPLLFFGQEDGKPEKDTSENKDPSWYKNEVGVGIHSFHLIPFLVTKPDRYYLLFQGSYKRKLEHFTLRAGLGGGKEYLYPNRHRENNGWIGRSSLFFNVGLEKTVWRIGDHYEMGLALDLVHQNRWAPLTGARSSGDGFGLAWENSVLISPRSSVSIEAGLSILYLEGWSIDRVNWDQREWGIGIHRGIVLSYNYHF